MAERFGGGELWFDVCGTMMSRHGVKPDSLREHEAQIRSGLSDGRLVEQWEPRLRLLEQANYMKFFRPRWGFFFGQILGRMTRLVLQVQFDCWDMKSYRIPVTRRQFSMKDERDDD